MFGEGILKVSLQTNCSKAGADVVLTSGRIGGLWCPLPADTGTAGPQLGGGQSHPALAVKLGKERKNKPPKMTGQAGGLAGHQGVQVLGQGNRLRQEVRSSLLGAEMVSWIVH